MKTIAFVIPYFGTLPKGFQVWLNSCKFNPTINWLLYTDDMTPYEYPDNVKRIPLTMDKLKEHIQTLYDFPIVIDRPWKLCDFKVAYGEIFADELAGFDFWGFCDIDLIWGDIRKFYTEELLEEYDKIGFQGHATVFKNTPENNRIYRSDCDGCVSYREVFSVSEVFGFDEWICSKIFKNSGKKVYEEVNFAHLQKYSSNFFLLLLPNYESYKNEKQIFVWEKGKIIRYYLADKKIFTEEFMYLHFWCRPTTYRVKDEHAERLVIYPDIVSDKAYDINYSVIKKLGAKRPIRFYSKMLWRSRKKLTLDRIIKNVDSMVKLNKYVKEH